MFPIFAGRKLAPRNKRDQQVPSHADQQLCPLGCLCCIMEQFYGKKCWCRETRESVGTQTDEPHAKELISRQNTNVISTACQTDPPATAKSPRKRELDHIDVAMHVSDKETETTNATSGEARTHLADTAVPEMVKHRQWIAARKYGRRKRRAPSGTRFDLRRVKSPEPMATETEAERCRSRVTNKSHVTVYGNRTTSGEQASAEDEDGVYRKYFHHGMMEYSQMQNTMGQLVEQYDLTGARDVNFELALCDVFRRFPELADDAKTRKIVRDKLRHKISSRRHYHKMKSEASMSGIGVSVLKKHRRHENDLITSLIGETAIHNSLQTQLSPTVGTDGTIRAREGSRSLEEKDSSGSCVEGCSPPCAEDLSMHRETAIGRRSLLVLREHENILQTIKKEPVD